MCKAVTLEKKAEEYLQLKKQLDMLQAQVDGLKDFMKTELARRKVSELTVGQYRIMDKPVVSMRFDSTEFKEGNPEMFKAYLRESASTRFSVK